jgi:hypothetical protein
MTDSTIAGFPGKRLGAHRAADRNLTSAATSRRRARAGADFSHYRERSWANVMRSAFGAAAAAVLWIGWLNRDDGGLTPKSGVGYWLGVVGSILMLLLLLYPLRKRMRSLRVIGTVPFWFRAHMILGACGCGLVIWHANFHLGAINSNVALAAMLVVVASGFVGRYLHGKVHQGLYGRKAVVQEILADAEALKKTIQARLPVADRALSQLNAFAQLGAAAPEGVLAGLVFWPMLSWRGSLVRMRLIADARRVIAIEGRRLGQSGRVRRRRLAAVAELVTLHVVAVKKAATFGFYERLFSLWHFLHVPLFVLLVVATITHVFAVQFF